MNKEQITNDVLHKEIELVQGIIQRMSNNSFLIKGWTVTIFTSFFVFLKEEIVSPYILFLAPVLIFSITVFWYLDSFFLHKEKCYRGLYEYIISNRFKETRKLYSLDYRPFEDENSRLMLIMLNNTIWPIYLLPIILILGIMIFTLTYL